MSAVLIDGKKISDEIRAEAKQEAASILAAHGWRPGLAVVLVGDNPSSQLYVSMKGKACAELGFHSVTELLPASTSERHLLALVDRLNNDPAIHGILVQLPLPKQIREQNVLRAINPEKDVDGFHPFNVGRLMIGEETLKPCTPAGVQELLIRSGNLPAGKHVVVAGRSNIVGKPVAAMLALKAPDANAVVTLAHTGAKDLGYYTRQADILIAAIGQPELITGDMVKDGVVVIDVGTSRLPDATKKSGYRTVGDVHFASVFPKAKAITPVPGGVGPMTIAMLMSNTLKAAKRLHGI